MSIPRFGHRRCYWTLLSPNLQVLYIDPVLQAHLSDNPDATDSSTPTSKQAADALTGRHLLDFVHPDEQATAKIDVGGVLESKTLHGSVTRVRFSSINKIRTDLGAAAWPEPFQVGTDKDFIQTDLVINLAADGLVLCFMHAVQDVDPEKENDYAQKDTQPWTNWCGTPNLTPDQIQVMASRLIVCSSGGEMGPHTNGPGAPPGPTGQRVFQILANDEPKSHLITWPPMDDRPLSRFAQSVDFNAVNSNAKTCCTARLKASNFDPALGAVESIFIPHGSIIFACHKVGAPNMPPSAYDYYMPNAHYPYHQAPAWNRAGNPYYDPAGQPPPQQPPTAYPYDGGYLPPPPEDEVPPPRRRQSPMHQEPDGSPNGGSSGSARGNRPAGLQKCTSCKATSSPEWRKGPSGKKELCNACGLRFARSRAKRDGSTPKTGRGGGKARSSSSVAAMKREGSVTSSSGGIKQEPPAHPPNGGPEPPFDGNAPVQYQPGPAGYPPSDPKTPAYPPPPEGERFYPGMAAASYERSREE